MAAHPERVEFAIIGSGIAGIAVAYYLCSRYGRRSVLLVDHRQPMSYTSAQSGDNYRNWWPHPTMTAFTDYSIDLMEVLAVESGNAFNMTRRGYVLATRDEDIDSLVADLCNGYGARAARLVRVHDDDAPAYRPADSPAWQDAPEGVDVLCGERTIRRLFAALSKEIRTVIHVRRAGDLSGQQLGMYLYEKARAAGAARLAGEVTDIVPGDGFELQVRCADGNSLVRAGRIVNAAGPFAGCVARMLGVELPVRNVFQQKIAFDDALRAVPRTMPFTIDLDDLALRWTAEERALLAADEEYAWLAGALRGGVHCRPDGAESGSRVKLGWAFNREAGSPPETLAADVSLDARFPELVMRRAAMLLPALERYIESPPAGFSHYGGYYTMTAENWPLIGPLGVDGAYLVAALSGFGSMAACAAGAVCAAWACDADKPEFAADLSLARHADTALLDSLRAQPGKGIL